MNRISIRKSLRFYGHVLFAVLSLGVGTVSAHALDAQQSEDISKIADGFFRRILSGGGSAVVVVSELEAETKEEYADDTDGEDAAKPNRSQPKIKDLEAFQSLYEAGGGDFRVLEHIGGKRVSDSVFIMPELSLLENEGDLHGGEDAESAHLEDDSDDDLTIDPSLATDAPLFVVLDRITATRSESPSKQMLYKIAVDEVSKKAIAFRVSGLGDSVARNEKEESEEVVDKAGGDQGETEAFEIPELSKSFVIKQLPKFIKAAEERSEKVPAIGGKFGEIFQGSYRRVVLPAIQQ